MASSQNTAFALCYESARFSALPVSDNIRHYSKASSLPSGTPPVAARPRAALPMLKDLRACLIQFIPSLVAILHRRFAPDVAEEAAQDALVVALAYIKSGRAARLPNRKAWLTRVAINKGNAILRSRRRETPLKDPNTLPDRANRSERFQVCAAVLDALAALPDDEQCLIEQLYFANISERKAAESLGISQSTLRRRRAAVLKRLRDAL